MRQADRVHVTIDRRVDDYLKIKYADLPHGKQASARVNRALWAFLVEHCGVTTIPHDAFATPNQRARAVTGGGRPRTRRRRRR
ncbi:MAG: hypothetical protein ABIF82_12190 [Planctomycetota bacterium]